MRDEIRYNPYVFSADHDPLKASHALAAGESYCAPKALLLAACARHCGIPARIGLADVRNHLSTPRLIEMLRSEVFAMHGYTELFLEGRWVKATTAFNIELCRKFGFLPLEFDGRHDSLYHPFDREGRRHMEYVNERGEYDDAPLDAMLETFRREYPKMALGGAEFGRRDFDAEVEAEVAGND